MRSTKPQHWEDFIWIERIRETNATINHPNNIFIFKIQMLFKFLSIFFCPAIISLQLHFISMRKWELMEFLQRFYLNSLTPFHAPSDTPTHSRDAKMMTHLHMHIDYLSGCSLTEFIIAETCLSGQQWECSFPLHSCWRSQNSWEAIPQTFFPP